MPLEFFDLETRFVDSKVSAERMIDPTTRQVVAIILLSRDGKRYCLMLPEKAVNDGRLNLSPPQGDIGEYESIWTATNRVILEELHVNMHGPVVYLGSRRRMLPQDHPHIKEYRQYRYHWVSAYAEEFDLKPTPSVKKAHWYYLDTAVHMVGCMSAEKGQMFRDAVGVVRNKAANIALIRSTILEKDRSRLPGILLSPEDQAVA